LSKKGSQEERDKKAGKLASVPHVELNADQLKAIEKKDALLEVIGELESIQHQVSEFTSKKGLPKKENHPQKGLPEKQPCPVVDVRRGRAEIVKLWVSLARLECVPRGILPDADVESLRILKTILDSLAASPGSFEPTLGDLLDWMDAKKVSSFEEVLPSYKFVAHCVQKIMAVPNMSSNSGASKKQPKIPRVDLPKSDRPGSKLSQVQKPSCVPAPTSETACVQPEGSIPSTPMSKDTAVASRSLEMPAHVAPQAATAAENRYKNTPRTTSRLPTANRSEPVTEQPALYFPVSYSTSILPQPPNPPGVPFGSPSFSANARPSSRSAVLERVWGNFTDSAILRTGPLKVADPMQIAPSPASSGLDDKAFVPKESIDRASKGSHGARRRGSERRSFGHTSVHPEGVAAEARPRMASNLARTRASEGESFRRQNARRPGKLNSQSIPGTSAVSVS
jgi:hypothetical protein